MTIHLCSVKVTIKFCKHLLSTHIVKSVIAVVALVQYSKSVSENINGSSYILSVTASDLDAGLNKLITYAIKNVTVIGSVTPTEAKVHTHIFLSNIKLNFEYYVSLVNYHETLIPAFFVG